MTLAQLATVKNYITSSYAHVHTNKYGWSQQFIVQKLVNVTTVLSMNVNRHSINLSIWGTELGSQT